MYLWHDSLVRMEDRPPPMWCPDKDLTPLFLFGGESLFFVPPFFFSPLFGSCVCAGSVVLLSLDPWLFPSRSNKARRGIRRSDQNPKPCIECFDLLANVIPWKGKKISQQSRIPRHNTDKCPGTPVVAYHHGLASQPTGLVAGVDSNSLFN